MNDLWFRIRVAWSALKGNSVLYNVSFVQYDGGTWIVYKNSPDAVAFCLNFYSMTENGRPEPSTLDSTMLAVLTPDHDKNPMQHLITLGTVADNAISSDRS